MVSRFYSLLIFDFDGTLVDTAPDIAYHVNTVLAEFGYAARTLPEIKKAVGLGVHQLMCGLAPGLAENPPLLERMVALFKEKYSQLPVKDSRPYPGIPEIFSGPLGDIPKAIVTNKPYSLTVEVLKSLRLEHHFGFVIGNAEGVVLKPDPSSVFFILRQLGCPASRAVFIGDSAIDWETAKNAGVDFVWMDYGYDGSLEGRPVRRLSRPEEWKRLVDSGGNGT